MRVTTRRDSFAHVAEARELRSVTLFSGLTDDDLDSVARLADRRPHWRGDLIVWPDQASAYTYLLTGGAARMYRLSTLGKRVTLDEFVAGDAFGFPDRSPSPLLGSYVEVTSKSAVTYRIRGNHMCDLEQIHSSIRQEIVGTLLGHLADVYDQAEGLATLSVSQRLAREFIRVAGRNADHLVWDTHEQLANRVGTSRDRVSKLLGVMRRRGLIRRPECGRGVVVPDFDLLAAAYRL